MIILGAGLAGLSAAYHGGGGVIYEMADEIGGHSKSKVVDGFIFDEGIHVLQTKNEGILRLLNELGVQFQEHSRSGWIYANNGFSPYPFQVNTARLPLRVRAECVLGYMRTMRASRGNGERGLHTYEDWLNASLGRGFTKHFFLPYSEKFWTVHPREMTYQWAGVRVPQPQAWDVVKGAFREQKTQLGTHVQFRYPREGGFGALGRAFEPFVEKLHLGKRVTRIDGRRKMVQFNGTEETAYDRLISTLPLPDVVAMMPDAPTEVRAAAGRLRHNSILVVNLGINRPKISEKHWAHFPQRDLSFFRISFPMNFAPGLAPPGTSSVSAEVSYSPDQPVDAADTTERVIDDLRRIGVLRRDDRTVLRDTIDIKYAYVIYDHAREEAVRTIHGFLRRNGVIPCGRYGSWAYFWSDEAILSGQKAAAVAATGAVEEADLEEAHA